MTLLDFFPGMKTYAVALGMIVTAITPAVAELDPSAVDWNLLLEGFGLAFLRKGIKSRA